MTQGKTSDDRPWYERFFDERYLRAYEAIFAAADPVAEADFAVRELGLEPGSRLLDLCCGQGRHAVPLARRGFRVTGYDLSACLLEKAEESARAAGVPLELVRGDMREIPWVEELDGAVNLCTAFGYFEDDRKNLGRAGGDSQVEMHAV